MDLGNKNTTSFSLWNEDTDAIGSDSLIIFQVVRLQHTSDPSIENSPPCLVKRTQVASQASIAIWLLNGKLRVALQKLVSEKGKDCLADIVNDKYTQTYRSSSISGIKYDSMSWIIVKIVTWLWVISTSQVHKGLLTWQVPRIPFGSLCEWTERWTTPSGPHIAPPEGRTSPAGVCGTFRCTGYLKEAAWGGNQTRKWQSKRRHRQWLLVSWQSSFRRGSACQHSALFSDNT